MSENLVSKFYQVTQQYPDNIALCHGDAELSYSQLLNLIADFKTKIDYLPVASRVVLLMENSANYIAAYYAAWWCGFTIVALNTQLKAGEIHNLLEHCGAKLLIADAKHRELEDIFSPAYRHTLLVGEANYDSDQINYWIPDEQAPTIEQPYSSDANELAAIIYTSGTTGHPKGVMLSHENLYANCQSIQRYLDIRSDDRVMCVLPFYYSYGNSVLHTHLSKGATIILENSMMYPHKVLEKMSETKATAFYGVPSTYYLLLSRTKLNDYDLSSMRYCAQAGGAMDSVKIEAFKSQVPSAQFIVMYGQTEASARLSYLPPERLIDKPKSVGVPIPGVSISIRDDAGHEVAVNQQGEVCAQGPNIMLGYLNDAEETARTLKSGCLYTGDLGYLDKDGFLFLVGRNKEMIKVGANRISPREIEEVISAVPGVHEVAVVGEDDQLLGQVIKACVVASNPGAELKKAIQFSCRQQLAIYKIPKTIDFFDELPKTASGKVKKYLL